ncbi:hypothetical protein ACQ4PT_035301 [Festuca glaucescens]
MDRVSTDVLVEILQRLPHSRRRRARHVCRRWRDVVNNRITETRSTPKLLIWSHMQAVAYVADDLSPSSTGSCTELWRPQTHYHLIASCNGLLCMYNRGDIMGGAITVANPSTGETMSLPPMPCAANFIGRHGWEDWHGAYSFAYHPTTGQFKVVHVPCSYERVYDFHAVHVFTLGNTTWREVSAGPSGAMCKLEAGVLSIHGMTYWVTITRGAAAKIVSFDLTDDRVISATTPVPARHDHCRLTEVHERLGYIVWPDVWVLVEGKRWIHRYSFEEGIPRHHFVYGEYVLTCNSSSSSFYGHRLVGSDNNNLVLIGQDKKMLVAKLLILMKLSVQMLLTGSDRNAWTGRTRRGEKSRWTTWCCLTCGRTLLRALPTTSPCSSASSATSYLSAIQLYTATSLTISRRRMGSEMEMDYWRGVGCERFAGPAYNIVVQA